jgi:predicted TIM-barrel fold metal-dependent hydrolase
MHASSKTFARLPSLACDTHVHIVGARSEYPMIAERQYTAGPAALAALREHLGRCGFERTVLIQPSFYGTDNRCLLHGLRLLGDQARGVAVLDEQITDTELQALHEQGIRGIRLNVESSVGADLQALSRSLARWAERLAPLGWHIQLYAALHVVDSLRELLDSLPVDLVLDHFAMAGMRDRLTAPSLAGLKSLLLTGKVWVKLSAPYRPPVAQTSKVSDAHTQVSDSASQLRNFAPLAAEFLQIAPHRVLWGSDWPHTQREAGKGAHEESLYRSVTWGSLVQQIHAWLPTQQLLQSVLVDNPAALYWKRT